MPASEPPDPGVRVADGGDTLAEQLDALETAVHQLLAELGELRERADRAEAVERSLAEALAGAGDLEEVDAGDARVRFRELAEENRVLRHKVEEGRKRAERIRSRLIMMEDEV